MAAFVGTHAAQSVVLQIRSLPLVTVSVSSFAETPMVHGAAEVLVIETLKACFPPCLSLSNPAKFTRRVAPWQASGDPGVAGEEGPDPAADVAEGLVATVLADGVTPTVGVAIGFSEPFGQPTQAMTITSTNTAAITIARRRQ